MKKIRITAGEVSVFATLDRTPTARRIAEALPLEGTVNVWGDEIYFEIPVSLESDPEARADVDVGDLGYWPMGSAFCIFFGPTPVSTGSGPRAYSPVNLFGRVEGDPSILRQIPEGATIRIAAME
jgi:uncharacterized protein